MQSRGQDSRATSWMAWTPDLGRETRRTCSREPLDDSFFCSSSPPSHHCCRIRSRSSVFRKPFLRAFRIDSLCRLRMFLLYDAPSFSTVSGTSCLCRGTHCLAALAAILLFTPASPRKPRICACADYKSENKDIHLVPTYLVGGLSFLLEVLFARRDTNKSN